MFDLGSEGHRHIARTIINFAGVHHIGPLSQTCKLVHAWYYSKFDEQLENGKE